MKGRAADGWMEGKKGLMIGWRGEGSELVGLPTAWRRINWGSYLLRDLRNLNNQTM
jgi:hypothetical protein